MSTGLLRNSTVRKKALILIDMQHSFLAPDGKKHVDLFQANEIIETANLLIKKFNSRNDAIIYIVNEFDNVVLNFLSGNIVKKGTIGAQLDKRLVVVNNLIFSKWRPSAFSNNEFKAYLQNLQIKQLYILGLAAEGCVNATIKDSIKYDYEVKVIREGIAALKTGMKDKMLNKYQEYGAKVISLQNENQVDAVLS